MRQVHLLWRSILEQIEFSINIRRLTGSLRNLDFGNRVDVAPLKDDEGREVMRHWRPGEEVKGEGQGLEEMKRRKEEQISLNIK